MVGDRDGPALGDGGGDQQELELAQRPEGLRPAPQRVGRKAAGRHRVDRALVGQQRTGLPGSQLGRDDHGGHRRLGLAVHVHRPVEQLDSGGGLRDQAQKCQLDVARAQHRPGLGVLIAGRRLVERVVRGQQRPHLGLQFRVLRASDPLRVTRPREIAELNHSGSLLGHSAFSRMNGRWPKRNRRIVSQFSSVPAAHGDGVAAQCTGVSRVRFPVRPAGRHSKLTQSWPGGRNAANSSVTRSWESVKWYSAAGRPPLRPDCAMVPVWVMTPRRTSTRCRFVASTW